MKICFFPHYSFTNQDGATLSMLNIIDELIKRGHEIYMVVLNKKNLDKYISNNQIKKIYVPLYSMRINISQATKTTDIKFFIKSIINQIRKQKIKSFFEKEKIDLIHVNGLDSVVAPQIANELHIPYVYHIRQFMSEDIGKKAFEEKKLYGYVTKANSVIAISKDVKEKFEQIINREMDLVYNGVPKDNYYIKNHQIFKDKQIKLIIVGRIAEQKGQLEAVKAIKILKDKGYNVHLTIVGKEETPDILVKINAVINDYNLSNEVTVLGHNDDCSDLRRNSDIGLTCSLKEAFGRITIENMMSGLYVIGANTGGTTEIINDGKNGKLYEQGNAFDLATKIEEAINNKDKAIEIAKVGQNDSIQKFSIERVVDELELIYQKITL